MATTEEIVGAGCVDPSESEIFVVKHCGLEINDGSAPDDRFYADRSFPLAQLLISPMRTIKACGDDDDDDDDDDNDGGDDDDEKVRRSDQSTSYDSATDDQSDEYALNHPDDDLVMRKKIAGWSSRLDDLISGMTKTDEDFINNVCRPLCPNSEDIQLVYPDHVDSPRVDRSLYSYSTGSPSVCRSSLLDTPVDSPSVCRPVYNPSVDSQHIRLPVYDASADSPNVFLRRDDYQLSAHAACSRPPRSTSSSTSSPTSSTDSLSFLGIRSSALLKCDLPLMTSYANSIHKFPDRRSKCTSSVDRDAMDGSGHPIGRNAETLDEFSRSLDNRDEEIATVDFSKGLSCNDVAGAHDILTTKYRLGKITIRKSLISWSKWNISQIVRGPHEMSPIWNPDLKDQLERPGSFVINELNEDIERRDEALQKLAEYQLDYCNPHVQPPSPIEIYAFRDELTVPPSPPPLARSMDSPVGHRLLAPSPSAGCCPATSEKVAWIGNGNIIHRLFHAVWSRFSGE